MELGDKPRDDHQFPVFLQRGLHDFFQGVQLGLADLLGTAFVPAQEAAGQLREPQELGQDIGDGDFAALELGVAVLDKPRVQTLRLGFQGYLALDVDGCGKVEALGLGRPERDGMHPLAEFAFHGAFENGGVVAVTRHVEVAVSEGVEAVAEDGGFQKLVLAEQVDGLVGDRGAGEQQAVACFRAQSVHSFAGRDVVCLDLVSLVRDDQVGAPAKQFFFQSPRALVVDDRDLDAIACQLPEG